MTARRPTLAIYLPDLSGGGAERLHVQLAPEFVAAGWDVRFLLDRRAGALLGEVPAGIAVDALGASRQLAALPRLVRYLRRSPPDVLLANMEHQNVMALLARALSRAPTRVVVTQHNALSEQTKRQSWQWRALPALYRRTLPRADGIVAVSAGVADELAAIARIERSRIDVIHNGLVDRGFAARASGEPEHPWFVGGVPIVAAMGRLVPQKDFATLIRAFAALDTATAPRLLILGEGPLRAELDALAGSLGVADRVGFAGFVANPLPWLRRSALFVLSSRFEGFGNVLVEALACGTPVVSTDCRFGPSEILDGGRFGRLVPVGDPAALAAAIAATLVERPHRDRLRGRGAQFSVQSCASHYTRLFAALLDRHGTTGG